METFMSFKKILLVSAASSTLLLTACSNEPASADIEKALIEKHVVEGVMSLDDWNRSNGYKPSDNRYVVDVEYSLKFEQSYDEFAQMLKSEAGGGFTGFATGVALMGVQMEYGKFSKGDVIQGSETLKFVETEQGWQVRED
jgi:hypothetical protein